MNPYLNLAYEAADRHGIDRNLFAKQIATESNWNPNATSPAGAQGIAQFVPGTWKAWGKGRDPYDPAASLDAGAAFMAHLLAKYKGNYQLALAAYNAGEGAVAKHGGVPPYKETRNYIKKIMGKAPVDTRMASAGISDSSIEGMDVTGSPSGMGADLPDLQQGNPVSNEALQLAQQQLEALRYQNSFQGRFAGAVGAAASAAAGGTADTWWRNAVSAYNQGLNRRPSARESLDRLRLQAEIMQIQAQQAQQAQFRQWYGGLTPHEQLSYRASAGDPEAAWQLRQQGGSLPEDWKVQMIDGMPYRVNAGTGQLEPLQGYDYPQPGQQPAMDPKDRVNWSNTLADNYRIESQPFVEPIRRWNDVADYVPGKMDGAQQRSLVVGFAKALDPTSAVMENEASAVAQAAQKMPLLRQWYEATFDSSLPEATQRHLKVELSKLAKSRFGELSDTRGRYVQQFGAAGFGPKDPDIYLPKLPTLKGFPSGTNPGFGNVRPAQ